MRNFRTGPTSSVQLRRVFARNWNCLLVRVKDVLSSDNFCSNQASFGGAKDSLNNPLQASLLSRRMIALALWPGFTSSVPGLYSRAYQRRRDWNQKLFFLELIFPYIWHWALAISLRLEPCSFLHIMYSASFHIDRLVIRQLNIFRLFSCFWRFSIPLWSVCTRPSLNCAVYVLVLHLALDRVSGKEHSKKAKRSECDWCKQKVWIQTTFFGDMKRSKTRNTKRREENTNFLLPFCDKKECFRFEAHENVKCVCIRWLVGVHIQ